MTVDIEKSIAFMKKLRDNYTTYSMNGSRDGSDGTGDCSGTITRSLEKAGATKPAWLYNTDSMHAYLVQNGYELIADNKEWSAKRGDIVIFGLKGASGGAAGHVVEFVSPTEIIECAYVWPETNNAVRIVPEALYCPYNMGWYTYRLKNQTSTPSKPAPSKPSDSQKEYSEKGNYKTNEYVAIRESASTKGKLIGWVNIGSVIKYDKLIIDQNGYYWLRQPRANGKYGYVASGETKNGKRSTFWGTFF